jgi:hypothetical protein
MAPASIYSPITAGQAHNVSHPGYRGRLVVWMPTLWHLVQSKEYLRRGVKGALQVQLKLCLTF